MSYRATFSRNKNGDGYNARIVCDPEDAEDFEEGSKVKIEQKNGETVKRVIEKVLWTGDGDRDESDGRPSEIGKTIILAALKPDGGPPGKGGKGGSRKTSSKKDDSDDLPFS